VSEFTQKRLIENCPLPPEKTAIVYNALDPNLDPDSPVGSPGIEPVILSISRLTTADSYKGIDHLIAAMPTVCGAIPGARLRIVGRGDGLPALQAMARRSRVERIVEFTGYRNDSELKDEFRKCRLFALPSEKEGFGLVYLEAMSYGRPCLGARSGGVPEVISEKTGVLVEYGDVPGIAQGMIGALRRNWQPEPMLEQARKFSYLRFKERLASLLPI
jgi:glycosyltransferase involved in cell wall biosynthesis